jgi:hypothetical protein
MAQQSRPLSSLAIRALAAIILVALVGIIALSGWGLALRAGLLVSNPEALNGGTADEALSILGNIAAAAVGGLVGWLTRDLVVRDREDAAVVVEQTGADAEEGS